MTNTMLISEMYKRLFGGQRPISELNEAETQLHELGQVCTSVQVNLEPSKSDRQKNKTIK